MTIYLPLSVKEPSGFKTVAMVLVYMTFLNPAFSAWWMTFKVPAGAL
jgi:hypothetical protein